MLTADSSNFTALLIVTPSGFRIEMKTVMSHKYLSGLMLLAPFELRLAGATCLHPRLVYQVRIVEKK